MKIKLTLMAIALIALVAVAAFSPLQPALVFSQSKKQQDDKDKKKKAKPVDLKAAKGSGDKDENIKQTRRTNQLNADIPPPANKSGTRGTGRMTCHIDLDNSTKHYIDIYIDGYYEGTMGPWDDAHVDAGSGATRIYARAEFEDGSYLYWGPENFVCGNNQKDGYYTYRMLP